MQTIGPTHDSQPYQLVWLRNIDRLLQMTDEEVSRDDFTFVDIGCGLGIACIYASECLSFSKVQGLDFSTDLVSIACTNLRIANEKLGFQLPIRFTVNDARNHLLEDEASFVFMFNPFGFDTFRSWIMLNKDTLQRNRCFVGIANARYAKEILSLGLHATVRLDEKYKLALFGF